MEYTNEKQELDFIKRTQKVLKQYQELNIDEKNKFEVTLLVNCLVGLLIVPKEEWYEDLPDTLLTKNEWGIDPNTISFITEGEEKNIKNFVRHLRNSVSHYNFYLTSTNKKISSIRFEDFTDRTKTTITFDAIMKVEDLQKFLEKFSSTMLALKAS